MAVEVVEKPMNERRLSIRQALLLSIFAWLPIIMLMSNLSWRFLGPGGAIISLLLPFVIFGWAYFAYRKHIRDLFSGRAALHATKRKVPAKQQKRAAEISALGFQGMAPYSILVDRTSYGVLVPMTKPDENIGGVASSGNVGFFTQLSDGRTLSSTTTKETNHQSILPVVLETGSSAEALLGAHRSALAVLASRGIRALPTNPTVCLRDMFTTECRLGGEHLDAGGKFKTIPYARATSPELTGNYGTAAAA